MIKNDCVSLKESSLFAIAENSIISLTGICASVEGAYLSAMRLDIILVIKRYFSAIIAVYKRNWISCRGRSYYNFFIFFIFIFSFFVISNSSFADVVKTTDTIYQDAETNGIAVAICKAIDIGKIFMVPLFAIMFCIMGFRAFQGDGAKWSVFMTFALGMAAFNSAGTILSWFMPKMGLEYGCKCAVERDIRDVNGVVETQPTGLNYDCSYGLTDYYSLHGINSSGSASELQTKQRELNDLQKLASKYENLMDELNNLNSLIIIKEENISLIMSKRSSYRQIISSYANSDVLSFYNVLQNKVTSVQSLLKESEIKVSVNKQKLTDIERQINEMKNKIKSQQKVVDATKKNYEDALKTYEAYKIGDNYSENVANVLLDVVRTTKVSWKDAESILSQYEANLSNFGTDKDIQLRAIDVSQIEYNNLKQKYDLALKDVSDYEQRGEMKIYLQAKEIDQKLADEYNQLQTDLSKIKASKQIKENEINALASSYTDAKSRIPSLQIEIATLLS